MGGRLVACLALRRDAVAALYAEGASFFSHPFRGHQEPRDYAAWAFAEQLSAVCRFGPPSSRATGRRSTGGR